MSALSEQVRKAIFAKINVAGVVGSGKATAVYESKAPSDADFPYVVFNRQASELNEYTFTFAQTIESDLWQFRAYADEDSSTTKEPQQIAEEILILVTNTLGTTLTLSGNTVMWCAKLSDLPPVDQQLNDRYVYGRGMLYRIASE